MVVSLYKILATVAPDFSVFYLSTSDFLKGAQPYINPQLFTGVGYPPITFLFFVPFVLLPYPLSQALFTLISVVSIFAIVWISLILVFKDVKLLDLLLGVSLTLLSFPTKFTLGMGQSNVVAFAILLLSFYLYTKKDPLRSGLLLGLSILIKPIFGFFFLFYLLKREWKILFWASVLLFGATLLVFSFRGWELFDYYLHSVVPPLLYLSGREIYYNQGIMGFVSRLTQDLVIRKQLNSMVSLVLVGFISWITYRKKGSTLLQFSLFIITLLLIDTMSWQHHFVWLIFPFIVVAKHLLKQKNKVFWGLFVVSYLLVSMNIKNPTAFHTGSLSFLLSHTFYGTLILLFVVYSEIKNQYEAR